MTQAIDMDCDGYGEPAGRRCVGDVFCQVRRNAASRKTREENKALRARMTAEKR